jgi:hypothetical protein
LSAMRSEDLPDPSPPSITINGGFFLLSIKGEIIEVDYITEIIACLYFQIGLRRVMLLIILELQ